MCKPPSFCHMYVSAPPSDAEASTLTLATLFAGREVLSALALALIVTVAVGVGGAGVAVGLGVGVGLSHVMNTALVVTDSPVRAWVTTERKPRVLPPLNLKPRYESVPVTLCQ